jgi:hypothetical protein
MWNKQFYSVFDVLGVIQCAFLIYFQQWYSSSYWRNTNGEICELLRIALKPFKVVWRTQFFSDHSVLSARK